MTRSKRLTVATFAKTPSAAKAEFNADVHDVLRAANLPAPTPELEASRRVLREALTLLAAGADVHLPGELFTLRQRVKFDHLKAEVLSGTTLYCCKQCELWNLAKHKTQRLCTRDACQRRDGAARTKASRDREYREQRAALERVTTKRRERTI